MWAIIATWAMAKEGVIKAGEILSHKGSAMKAALACVNDVEENPTYTSVGLGGLPNSEGLVYVDGAAMDGDTLGIGSVMSMHNFLNPSTVASTLVHEPFNNVLVGKGAEGYALSKGFEPVELLTQKSLEKWRNHSEAVAKGLEPYTGHDTVCAIALDNGGSMASVTSTSGLFYKQPGRVGDSPLPGSGFYVDSEVGGAAATGLGEDIMKGLLSYEVVRLMASGLSPQEACERAVTHLDSKLKSKKGKAGDLSVVALDKAGHFGAATNIEAFPFVVMTSMGLSEGIARYSNNQHILEVL